MDGVDVQFESLLTDHFTATANCALKCRASRCDCLTCQGRKLDAPEVDLGVEESNAVGIGAIRGANLSDDADVGFFIGFPMDKDQLLLDDKLVLRNDTCAVTAQDYRLCFFYELLTIGVAAGQENGDLFGNAAAAPHVLPR